MFLPYFLQHAYVVICIVMVQIAFIFPHHHHADGNICLTTPSHEEADANKTCYVPHWFTISPEKSSDRGAFSSDYTPVPLLACLQHHPSGCPCSHVAVALPRLKAKPLLQINLQAVGWRAPPFVDFQAVANCL
jgi:hypothetical protein